MASNQQSPAPQFGLLQEHITRANEAVIDVILAAARMKDVEPLAAPLLGLSDEALEAYRLIRKYDLMQASKIGFTIFVPRITDPAVLRSLLERGMEDPSVVRALTKTLPLQLMEKRK